MVKILMIVLLMSTICFGQYVDDLSKLTVANIVAKDSVNLYVEALNGSSALTPYKLPLDTVKVWLKTYFQEISDRDSSFITQIHRIDTVNVANTSWNYVKWDTTITSETTYGYSFDSDSTGIVVSFAGVVRVQGCLHWKNNSGGSVTTNVAARVLVNSTEARCLQSLDSIVKNTGEEKTMPYIGTVDVSDGDTIRVQYRSGNINVDLEGDAWFDNPVAASVNFERID